MHDCEKVSIVLKNWFSETFAFNILTDKKIFILGLIEKQIAWKTHNCTDQFKKKWKLFERLKTQV